MRLDHESVKSEVESPLGELQEVFPVAGHVARVCEEREFRVAGPKLDGYLPARIVAIEYLLRGGESAVDDSEFLDSGPVETLEGADPEVEVRVDRVLDEYRDVSILEGVGNFLHEERVGGRAGSHPYHVDTELYAFIYVLFAGHLGADLHSEFFLDFLHPLEAWHAHAFEAARMGPWLPYSGTEDVYS